MQQLHLFKDLPEYPSNLYRPYLTAMENGKGVLDVDTVKGCSLGMAVYPQGGCYGECYANKTASRYGLDFKQSVSRKLFRSNRTDVFITVKNHIATWYRVGTAGDPCHDWNNTIEVLQFLKRTGKTPVIITKHWVTLTDEQLLQLQGLGAVVNTSISALDTEDEFCYRVEQIGRLKYASIKSVARVITCEFGETQQGKEFKKIQDYLLSFESVIDNPLRASKNNQYVKRRDVLLNKKGGWTGSGSGFISLHHEGVYLGTCGDCPDQCGVDHAKRSF
jgi:hypothetical protein